MEKITIREGSPIKGIIRVPADKSISHRALILNALSKGKAKIENLLEAEDILRTVEILKSLGVEIHKDGKCWKVNGKGWEGLKEPQDILDAGNSGTTARLILGVLSSLPFFSVLTGDNSLRRRPMRRVVEPLRMMGASLWGREEGNYLPIAVKGGNLKPIHYALPVASAQVKSALILAALHTEGTSIIEEPLPSRDHTERMVNFLEGKVEREGKMLKVKGIQSWKGKSMHIPGDISSAAYFISLALLKKGSQLIVEDVGLNPTRMGFLHLLKEMGGEISWEIEEKEWEPRGKIEVKSSPLKSITVDREKIPLLIDEVPLLAVLATQAEGTTVIKGAEELRVKESDRISTICENLKKMGAKVEEREDGMIIEGPTPLKGAKVKSFGDHRVAMSMAVAGWIARGETVIEDYECVNISFPSFFDALFSLKK